MGVVGALRFALAATLAAAPVATAAPPQTMHGAYERAVELLQPVTRGAQLERRTEGAPGEKNHALDALHQSEEPFLVQPPLSGPWH